MSASTCAQEPAPAPRAHESGMLRTTVPERVSVVAKDESAPKVIVPVRTSPRASSLSVVAASLKQKALGRQSDMSVQVPTRSPPQGRAAGHITTTGMGSGSAAAPPSQLEAKTAV